VGPHMPNSFPSLADPYLNPCCSDELLDATHREFEPLSATSKATRVRETRTCWWPHRAPPPPPTPPPPPPFPPPPPAAPLFLIIPYH